MALNAVVRDALPQVIVGRIRDYITDQKLQPGDRLPPERSMMEQLRVGRSSVREAMKILTTMGLVEIRRGDGAYVAAHAPLWSLAAPAFILATEKHVLRDIVELRRSIEPMAAFLAASRATDEDIAEFAAMLHRHQELLARQESWHWEPLEFEVAIAESTGNALLARVQRSLQDLWIGLSTEFRSTVDHTADWLHEHWVIFSAIKDHHPSKARDAVLLHLDLVRIERDLRR